MDLEELARRIEKLERTTDGEYSDLQERIVDLLTRVEKLEGEDDV
jgi:hypothetical protein